MKTDPFDLFNDLIAMCTPDKLWCCSSSYYVWIQILFFFIQTQIVYTLGNKIGRFHSLFPFILCSYPVNKHLITAYY